MAPRFPSGRSLALTSIALIAAAATAHAQPGLVPADAAPAAAPARPDPGWFRIEVGTTNEATWIDATTDEGWTGRPSGVLPTGGRVTARGFNARLQIGGGGGYGGAEFSLAWIDAAPVLLRPPGAGPIEPINDPTDPEDSPIPNSLVGMRVFGGSEARVGPVYVGGELALGLGSVTLGGERVGDPWVVEPRLLLDLRGRAGVALSERLTLGVMASTSLIRRDERSLGVFLGVRFGT